MEKFSIENILNVEDIKNELELEQANSSFNKLRLLIKEDASLKPLRKHLADLIEKYESKHWADEEEVSDEQIIDSENAEKIIQYHDEFIQKRKELIKNTLRAKNLLQNDFADILGHRKNYVSELINGIRPFSQDDIITIHRVFKIPLDQLVIPILKETIAKRVRLVIRKLNSPYLKLKSSELTFPTNIPAIIIKHDSKIDEKISETLNIDRYDIDLNVFSRMRKNRSLISV